MGLLLFTLRVTGVQQHGAGFFVYTRDQLIALQPASIFDPTLYRILNIPDEIRRRTVRGCRDGRKRRRRKVEQSQAVRKEKARKYKPYLRSLIMGNMRSLNNKMDELTALVRKQNIFRECSLMCFMETWLHDGIPNSSINIDGFSVVRSDRR